MTQFQPSAGSETPQHFVLIDGPSIDTTLGEVIGRPPTAEVRPNWRLLEPWVRREFGHGFYTAWFATLAPGSPPFVNFLESAGFRSLYGQRYVPGEGCADKIAEQIDSLPVTGGSWSLLVFTQQDTLIRQLPKLAQQLPGEGRVAVCGFTEFFLEDPLLESVIEFFDIEDDARLFRMPLPREDAAESADAQFAAGRGAPPASSRPPAVEPTLFAQRDASDGPAQAEAGLIYPFERREASAETIEEGFEGVVEPSDGAERRSDLADDSATSRPCYLLIDGHNIDQELGQILGEKPTPNTRPDWGIVLDFVRRLSRSEHGEVVAHFAHIAPGHAGFRRAITELGFRSMPVKQDDNTLNRPVVEEFVCSALTAKTLRGEGPQGLPAHDIYVVGHSPYVFQALLAIPQVGQRICALGFPERMPPGDYPGIDRIDIEHATGAFASTLPRQTGFDVDDFDPEDLFE